MKVIFLDIDGVLVTWDSLSNWSGAGHKGSMISPECAKVLNEIIEKTGAKIVVSSTWRMGRTMDKLKEELSEGGVNVSNVIGKTSILHTIRGVEISKWLYDHANSMTPVPLVESFCIIDDDSDMGDLKHRLVQTSMKEGLTEAHISQVLSLLN